MDELRFYEGMSHEDLFKLLFTEEDRLPREAVHELVKRGAVSVGAMTTIIENENLWKVELPEWWAPVHAVNILGAIGGEKSCDAILKAIELAERYDNDWIMEALPPIIGTLPPAIVPGLKKIITNDKLDWFARICAAEGLAALTLQHEELEKEVFEFLGDVFMHNKDDDMIDHVGCILMDFKRQEYFDALCERGRNRGGFGVVFTESDVKKDFAGRRTVERYKKDWLSFYEPQQIVRRQARWREEDARAQRLKGKILDDGMCICPECGERTRIGGFLPASPTPEEGVRCIDCMNAMTAEREGISLKEAAERRERMLGATRVMNTICTERYFRESKKESFDSITEANSVLKQIYGVWNALSTDERHRVEALPAEDMNRYFEHMPIDFQTLINLHKYGKPSRNDSCFCGSGKKYKKCCIDKVH